MKISFYTLGCKVNQFESEALADHFEKEGFEITSFEDICDVYVVNTCMVTAQSERKCRQVIRRAKQNNPHALLVVTGCYSQLKHRDLCLMSEIDIITGTGNRLALINLVKNALNNRNKTVSVENITEMETMEDLKTVRFFNRTRASIKIEDGCENFCSYCIIPYTRGPIRSIPPSDVINRVVELSDKGFLEIVLTGIQISAYGKEFGTSLMDLLSRIEQLPGHFRIRLGSLNPFLFTDEFIHTISSFQKLCPHFHISLQSGSDRILSAMNRKYDTHLFKAVMDKIYAALPNASITTDIIVGFPGESEEDFKKTQSFVDQNDFLHCHIFPYSKRPGTKAHDLPGQLDRKTKEERAKILSAAAMDAKIRYLKRFDGACFEVLFEGQNKEGYYEGFTPNYIPVYVKSGESLKNTLQNVRLHSIFQNGYIGRII